MLNTLGSSLNKIIQSMLLMCKVDFIIFRLVAGKLLLKADSQNNDFKDAIKIYYE